MFAVEIEDINRLGTRDQLLVGSLAGAEKYGATMMLGWAVYRVLGPWIATPKRHIWRPQVMEAVKAKLHRGPHP